jgi:hypothetical protein
MPYWMVGHLHGPFWYNSPSKAKACFCKGIDSKEIVILGIQGTGRYPTSFSLVIAADRVQLYQPVAVFLGTSCIRMLTLKFLL